MMARLAWQCSHCGNEMVVAPQLLSCSTCDLKTARFQLLYRTYYQFLLFPLVWLARRLRLSVDWKLERQPPAVVSSLLQSINDAEVTWFQGKWLLWGSSLVAIAAAL
jgi:hypothetical protein